MTEIMEDPLATADEMYKEHILDHYAHPHNKGTIANPTLHFRELNPLCGDEIELFVTLNSETVTAVQWQGKGCAISQAAASLLSDELKGKTLGQLHALKTQDVLNLLGIPIGPVRLQCANLPLRALQLALKEYAQR